MSQSAYFLCGGKPEDARRESEVLITLGFGLRMQNPITEIWEPDGKKVLQFWHVTESTEEAFELCTPSGILRGYYGLDPRGEDEELTDEARLILRLMKDLHQNQGEMDQMLGVERKRDWDGDRNCYKKGMVVPLVRVIRSDQIEVQIPTNATDKCKETLKRLAGELS